MMMKIHKAIILTAVVAIICEAETIYNFPPITHSTRGERHERFLNEGKSLMDIKGIPDESATLVCTNWVCPTSIVVNAIHYNLVTDEWIGVISADVMTTNVPQVKKAHVKIYRDPNAKEARRSVFAGLVQSDCLMPADFAPYIVANNLDPMTNMMYVTDIHFGGTNEQYVLYRNLTVEASAPTNAVDFAVAIINAGLPENERIVLPTQP